MEVVRVFVFLSLLANVRAATADPNAWCPRYHTIFRHYDPSGPILLDGTWHLFPDGGHPGWAHYTSTDLLNWKEHASAVANGDTGSVSFTEEGVVVLYPDLDGGQTGLKRSAPVGDAKTILPEQKWTAGTKVADNPGLSKGFRDPARALKMPDGSYYVGVGTGFGGTNNKTGLPGSGTGCLAWMKANNASLSKFEFVGCLLNNTHTDGHIDPSTVAWSSENKVAAFFECPDVFPLGDKYIVLASLYNWAAGGYYVNSFFVGTIKDNQFIVESRGPLDYGQYYAARSGTGAVQSGSSRRVLFSASGWHNPPGLKLGPACGTQMHLIPRDLLIDSQGRLTFNPIPELATLHKEEATPEWTPVPTVATASGIAGSSMELRMNCSGSPSSGLAGFDLLSAKNHTHFARVAYDFARGLLIVDHTQGGGPDSKIVQSAPLKLDADGKLDLVVLLDGALVEAFANRRAVISSFATHVFGVPDLPEARYTFALPSPAGSTCTFKTWAMKRLTTQPDQSEAYV